MAKKPTEISKIVAGFTDTKRVKDLVALMAENGLTEIELVEDKSRILLRRGTSTAAPAVGPGLHLAPSLAPAAPLYAPPAPASTTPLAQPDPDLLTIKSPMVGTYYAAPSPDAAPYVSVGSAVDDKTVVCIIEAMKVFNPIPAEVSGTIVKVLATNGQVVEYGQPLFLVKP
jgi:acetyl-CoA carboxylase biotin carboxyl carrier protein